ncbi:MAG TPA: DUF2779 domain-containing protein [Gemmatimonadaceae bacterium]|nr:DUF2779 domain-containing protein [Gemmatimonadaceae bacterium]
MTATPIRRERTLSKSDFKLARSCEAKLYFRENGYPDRKDWDPYLQMLARGGYMVEALAKAHYPDGIQLEYRRDIANDAELTRTYLERDSVTLFEATLLAGRRLARADVLQKTGNRVRLIEVKAKSIDSQEHEESKLAGKRGEFRTNRGISSEWRDYLEDITYQVLLLERLFPNLTVEPYLCLVDKSKRAQVSDIPTLFKVERHTRKDGVERVDTAHFLGDRSLLPQLDVLTEVSVAEEVGMLREEIEAAAARFESLLDGPLTNFLPTIDQGCRDCEFRINEVERNGFRECWRGLADVTPHILDLYSVGKVSSGTGSGIVGSLFQEGKASLFDIPLERLAKKDGTIGSQAERQRRQIAHMRSGEFWMSPRLTEQLGRVMYPAHFADFEVARLALPYHASMRPYGPVAFQWSNHTVGAPGATPVHGEWLNTEYAWPNEKFVRMLRAQIGDTGSVLTWSKFERSTLRQVIAELGKFGVTDPELSAWISDVAETRIVDMCEWAQNHFYHPGMGGRTSIKVVLDALWKSDAAMREQFESWMGLAASADRDPYASLPALEINGIVQDVREGTGAITAYEAMMYGIERDDAAAKEQWCILLRQYCALDSLSMVLIFEHLRRVSSRG